MNLSELERLCCVPFFLPPPLSPRKQILYPLRTVYAPQTKDTSQSQFCTECAYYLLAKTLVSLSFQKRDGDSVNNLGCRSYLGEYLPLWVWKCGTFHANLHGKVSVLLFNIQSQLKSLSKRLFCGPQAPYPAWLFAKHRSCVRTHLHLPILTYGEYKPWFDSFWPDISFNSTVRILVRAAPPALDAMQSKRQS